MEILDITWTDDNISFHFDEVSEPAVVPMAKFRDWLEYEYDLTEYIAAFSEYEPDGCTSWVGIDWNEVMDEYLEDKELRKFAKAIKISIHHAYN